MPKSMLAGCAALLMMGAATLAFADQTTAGGTAAAPPTGDSGTSGTSEEASRASKADSQPTGGSTATPQGREATMEPTPPSGAAGSGSGSAKAPSSASTGTSPIGKDDRKP